MQVILGGIYSEIKSNKVETFGDYFGVMPYKMVAAL